MTVVSSICTQVKVALFFLCFFLYITLFMACSSCDDTAFDSPTNDQPASDILPHVPAFNADTAFFFVEKQVSFGPRVPGTTAHQQCGQWLAATLGIYADTIYLPIGETRIFNNKVLPVRNIIGSFNPSSSKRILLAAHWDTRPFADQDSDSSRWHQPITGANDGASGVAVLLEIARQLSLNRITMGIDIIFFDMEDYGQPAFSTAAYKEDTYCLGAQYWTKNPHLPGYTAKYGILLDMVGGQGSSFLMEGYSVQTHPELVRKIWTLAHRLGFTQYFLFQKTIPVIDDHYYISTLKQIPTINIISLHPKNLHGFHESWHTHQDNLSIIDKNVLYAVGTTVLHAIYYEEAGKL